MDGKHTLTHLCVCVFHGDAQLPAVDTPKQTVVQGKVSNHKSIHHYMTAHVNSNTGNSH